MSRGMQAGGEQMIGTFKAGGTSAVRALVKTTVGKNVLRRIQSDPAVISNVTKATGRSPAEHLK